MGTDAGAEPVAATNIDAAAVNTVSWLASEVTSIVVPVYQRQYRWDIGGCEQLLADIRAVADSDERRMHFIGSILSAENAQESDAAQLVLIDGQQRITTLMLLIAALHHSVRGVDDALADELQRVLVRPGDPTRTKLRPHRAWAELFENVVLDRRAPADVVRESRFDANYAYFRSQIPLGDVPRIWAGLQKLEHVAITLGAGANAQQIFESLNSTGEPLRDHELIHNFVLMGLSHAEQSEIEDMYWLPIEQNTGVAIGAFWRHFMVMTTGREVEVGVGGAGAAERSVYDAFRTEFERVDLEGLHAHAAQWKEHSEIYRILLDPAHAPDPDIARHLTYLNTFGRAMYPLVMRAYHDYSHGLIEKATLIGTLEDVQSLLLRRTVVGVSTDRLVARLCRARLGGQEDLARAISRITPSDDRVRVALKFSPLPHPAYVLGRLAGVENTADFGIEHIVPVAPGDGWSGGDGERTWADFSDDEQNSHRALAETLGNLALLEDGIGERAADRSFGQKRALYARSGIPSTRELAELTEWGTAAISARTVHLTARFVQVWRHPVAVEIDDDGLTPILDAKRRRGWPPGWQQEWEYVEYRGEHWEVYDVKYLFNRVFKRLWADSRADVIAFSARRGGPIYPAQSWNGQWDALDEHHFLYMGWDSKYMLTAVQGVLEEAGLASEVFVKYSYIGNAMRG